VDHSKIRRQIVPDPAVQTFVVIQASPTRSAHCQVTISGFAFGVGQGTMYIPVDLFFIQMLRHGVTSSE
jgi:hypothetical protein